MTGPETAGNTGDALATGNAEGEHWVDLTHPVEPAMWTFPGDPVVRVEPAATIEGEGSVVTALHLGSHTGTHVDAPSHVLSGAATLDEVPLSQFAGPAVLVDVRQLPAGVQVGVEHLSAVADRLRAGVVVLLVTGWARHWGAAGYLNHPWLSVAAAQLLVDAGVRTVGIDAASVDAGPAEVLATHHVLAAAGCVIVENLTGLVPLLAEQDGGAVVEVSVLPLRITGGDGSPVRAVARVSR